MRTNLNEEIQKNLKLMGILNEAPSPSKGIFKILFGSLVGPSLDNAIAKIEAKSGQKLAGKGIAAFESAISNGWLTRKQATKLIVDALIESGQSIDDIAASVANVSPNFMKSVERASKSGVDPSTVKAAVPELAELSDNLVDAILKRGGYEAIGKTLDDTNKIVAEFIGSNKEIFEKLPWWKGGKYKNAQVIKDIQTEINKRFAGKNRTAVNDEIKQIFAEATESIKKSKLPETEKQIWYQTLGKWSKETTLSILKAPVTRDQVTNQIQIGWTLTKYGGALLGVTILGKLGWNIFSTGSATGGLIRTGKSEFEAGKQELAKKGDYENTIESFTKFVGLQYKEYDIKNFKLEKNSETEWAATYNNPNDGKAYGPFKFTFDNGIFKEQ
jgi:hypothetical protein